MSVPFLDTSILLRHVLNDDPAKSPACFALIQAIERGQVTVWTSELVIAEVVFVLESKRTYNLPRETIRDVVLPLIGLPGIKLTHKRLFRRIFDLYTTHRIDFIDCYHAVLMEQRGERTLYSYDTDFDNLPTFTRNVP